MDQTHPGDGAAPAAAGDPLLAIRAELDAVDELPITERSGVFERTLEVVVDQLRALELG